MTVEKILDDAIESGVYLYVEDNKLKYKTSGTPLGNQLLEQLKSNKKEIIERLVADEKKLTQKRFLTGTIERLPEQNKENIALSFAQQRLWFLDRYMGPSIIYNMPLAIRLTGQIDVDLLIKSLKEIVSRHDILRTRFEASGDSAVQIISNEALELHVESVDNETRLKSEYLKERSYQFNLKRDQLCRIRVIKIESNLENGTNSYALLVTMHHIISDGWSLGVFFKELVTIYEAFRQGEKSPLDPLPIQYADYAHWQRQWLQGYLLEQQLNYWREQLADLPPRISLPTDKPRPNEQTFNGGSVNLTLPNVLVSQLQQLSQNLDATLYMTLLSAFSVLMGRYSGQDDIAIGTPIANRTRQETEALIGFFVNTLVMRSNLSKNPSFIELLKLTRETALKAYAHQDIPFEQLVEEINPTRDLSHSPLFQVMFALQNTPVKNVELDNIHMAPINFSDAEVTKVARYDLTFNLEEFPGGIDCHMEYNCDLFEEATIQGMLNQFQVLLEGIVADPRRRISEYELLNKKEVALQLQAWNGPFSDRFLDGLPHKLIANQAELTPQGIALKTKDTEISFQTLNERSNQLAQYLTQQNLQHETLVAIVNEDLIETTISVLGVLKAGLSFTLIEPNTPDLRIEFLSNKLRFGLIIVNSSRHPLNSIKSQYLVFNDERIWSSDSTEPSVFTNEKDGAATFIKTSKDGVPFAVTFNHQDFCQLVKGSIGRFSLFKTILFDVECSSQGVVLDALRSLLPVNELKRFAADRGENKVHEVSHSNLGLYILDNRGCVTPTGIIGELYIGFTGAEQHESQSAYDTAVQFLPNRWGEEVGGRLFRTGERARFLADGRFILSPDNKNRANINNENQEIKSLTANLQGLDFIRDLVVIKNKSAFSGSFIGYIVPQHDKRQEGNQQLEHKVRQHLINQDKLLVIPQHCIEVCDIPTKSDGGVDEKALPFPFSSDQKKYVAPQTATEKTLVEIWQQKLSRERIGVEDNYFSLGGDSIRSIALVSAAQEKGLNFSIKDLFAYPTIRELANLIDEGKLENLDEISELVPFSLLTQEEKATLFSKHKKSELIDAFPLSMMQQGMLLVSLKSPALNLFENIQIYYFRSRWNRTLFINALDYLINKHPILKSFYDLSGERPIQIIPEKSHNNLVEVYLENDDENEVGEIISDWMEREKNKGIDTEKSLWRSTVHVLPDESFHFGMFIHHAMWDGWSLESFVTELYSTYDKLTNGITLEVEKALPSYNLFIKQELDAINSEEQKTYWIKRLSNIKLPWWSGRDKSPSRRISFDINTQQSQMIMALAARIGVQEKSIWCSVYLALLNLLNGSDEVVGPVATQGRPEIPGGEKIVGVFLNTLPLSISLKGRTWKSFIEATDQELRSQHEMRRFPLAEMQRLTGTDLSSSLFNYTNWHVYHTSKESKQDINDPTLIHKSTQASQSNAANYSLSSPKKVGGFADTNYLILVDVYKDELAQLFGFSISADTQIFDEQFCQRIELYVKQIVAQICTNVEANICRQSLLPQSEIKSLQSNWIVDDANFSDTSLIHHYIEENATKYPDRVALVYEGARVGAKQITYQMLNEQANRFAHFLIDKGIQQEELVGICVERSVEMIIGMVGVLKAGAAYVPLDPKYPESRLEYLITDSDISLVLCSSSTGEKFNNFRTLNSNGKRPEKSFEIITTETFDVYSGFSKYNPNINISSNSLAYVIYTSGSTGNPKGVCIRHKNAVSLLQWAANNANAAERQSILASTSICFDLSIYEIFLPLCFATECLLIDSILSLHQLQTKYRLTLINTVPSAAKGMLENLEGIVKVKLLNLAGEPLKQSLVKQLYATQKIVRIQDLYGPSEDTTYSTFASRGAKSKETIGKPVANTQAYILDSDFNLLPSGVVGELFLGGNGLSRGYLHKPRLTANKFIPNPFSLSPGERLYRTGDLVRFMNSGDLEYIGRIDHQVKIRGYRIELGEIESAIADLTFISDVVVIAREDRFQNKLLVAYCVFDSDFKEKQQEKFKRLESVKRPLLNQLPEYMVPAVIVELDALPLTANGKIDRKALPAPETAARVHDYVAPQTAMEKALSQVWSEVLGVARVGLNDNFFQLGGHSLLVMKVIAQLRQADIDIKVQQLFSTASLGELAQLLSEPMEKAAAFEVPANLIPTDCQHITPEMLPLITLDQAALTLLAEQIPGGYKNIQDIYPLGPLQEGILFSHRMSEHSDPYVLPSLLKINDRAVVDEIIEALQFIINRHDVLRTAFFWEGLPQAVQVVCREARLPVSWLALDSEQCLSSQLERLQGPEHQWMSLHSAPLLRMTVASHASEDGYFVLIQYHHMVVDHVSFEIIQHELSMYQSGQVSSLGKAQGYRQFIAHVQHQNSTNEGKRFFEEMLGGLSHSTTPFGLKDIQRDGSGMEECHEGLSAELSSQIRQLSHELKVSPSVLFHSAYAMLIASCSGQDDVVFGTVLSGRLQGAEGTENMLGLFINTLPLRVDLSGMSALDLVSQVKQRLHTLVSYEQTPLSLAQDCSELPGNEALFSAVINYRHTVIEDSARSEVEEDASGFLGVHERSNYPFLLSVSDLGELFSIELQVDGMVNAKRVVGYLQSALSHLVAQLSASSDASLRDLSLLSEEEVSQQLVDWNASQAAYAQTRCVHELFEAQANRVPDAVAIVYDGVYVTYGELNRQANQLAHYLVSQGVGAEVRVGISLERSPALLVGILGILKSGGAYVPIDPAHPRARLQYLVTDSDIGLLLTEQSYSGQFSDFGCGILTLDEPQTQRALAQESVSNVGACVTPDNLSYLIYTSGSTGEPKGVMGLHRSIVNRVNWLGRTVGVSDEAVLCQKTSIGFVDHVAEIFQALTSGAPLVIIDTEVLQTPRLLSQTLTQHAVSQITLVPSLLKVLLNSDDLVLGSLKQIYSSGESLHLKDLGDFEKRFPKSRLFNIYGSSEVGADVTAYELNQSDEESLDTGSYIGRVIDNTQAYVLSTEGHLVATGVTGELHIGGVALSRGYLNRGGLTAEKFVPHPFSDKPGERLYRTGDLVQYSTDGQLTFMGRADHQVKLRGFRIELGEVEQVVSSHPAVKSAVAVIREDVGVDSQLVCYVVGESNEDDHESDSEGLLAKLRRYSESRLPVYMVPSAMKLMDTLPLNASGKVDRQALPAIDNYGEQSVFVAPAGVTETLLASLWCQVLKREQVGATDNFFTLGGHSLLATQLLSHIREVFQVELPIRLLFEQPTLQAQSQAIEMAAEQGEILPLVKVSRDGPLPLSYAQQRQWFLSGYMGPSSVYNMPLALRLTGTVDVAALTLSLQEIVRRHEALRTRFQADGEQVVQVIDESPLSIAVETVADDVALQACYQSERDYQFNLSTEALCRIRLLHNLSDDSYGLLVTMHHIISDGWSLGIFFKELVSLYEAFQHGQASPLAPLAIQYADYAHWQREWLQGEVLEEQLEYWREALAGLPPLLTLPTDRPRPAEQTFNGSSEPVVLSQTLSAQLQALSHREGVTLYMSLLTAFSVLMSRYAGQPDVAIGTPIANRTRQATEDLIGFFVNTLVMRSDLSDNPRFTDLLMLTRETALQAYAHQDIPFEQLVEALNPARSLSHSPLFQVMFALQNVPVDSAELSEMNVGPLVFDADEESQAIEEKRGARFDLTLSLHETTGGISGGIEYNTDLFDRTTIQRMIAHYINLLEGIVASPECRVSDFELMSEAEINNQLYHWNPERLDYPTEQGVHQLFERQAELRPDAIAIKQGETAISYSALNQKAKNIATQILVKNLPKKACLGVHATSPIETTATILGVLKAGHSFSLLPSEIPSLLAQYLIELTGANNIVTSSPKHLRGVTQVSLLDVSDLSKGVQSTAFEERVCNLSQIAGSFYQFSSLKPPLAIEFTHRDLCRLLLSGNNQFSTLKKLFASNPIESLGIVFDALRSSLKGAEISGDIGEFNQITKGERVWINDAKHAGVYLLNNQRLITPVGAVGDIYIKLDLEKIQGSNRVTIDDEIFIPNVWEDGKKSSLYRSGIQGRHCSDGKIIRIRPRTHPLDFSDKKDLCNLLQQTLNHLSGVKTTLIIDSKNEQYREIVVYLVPSTIEWLDKTETLKSLVRKKLSENEFVLPIPMQIVVLRELPLRSDGSIDKEALPQPSSELKRHFVEPKTATEKLLVTLWQQQLSIKKVGIEDNYFSLGGDSIRSINLVTAAKEIGLDFSIKDLFANPTIKQLALKIDSGELEADVSIENLAPFSLLTDDEYQILTDKHPRDELEDAFPMSMMQQGMIVITSKQNDLNLYENLQLYHFNSEFNASVFDKAIDLLLKRHPVLRSIGYYQLKRPLQLVSKNWRPNISIIDISQLSQETAKVRLVDWMELEKEQGIDTEKELWRATIHLLPNDQFVFGMFLHHVLWDGWSLESFATELTNTYTRLLKDDKYKLEDNLPKYTSFISLELSALKSREHKQYWQKKLADTNVPWWTGQPKSKSHDINMDLGFENSVKLSRLAKQLAVQDKSILCSVYLTLLGLLNGNSNTTGVIATQGRPEIPDGDKVIGVFINALPVSIDFFNTSWQKFIKSVDKELRGQHEYRHFPFTEIQRLGNLDLSGSLFNFTNWHVYYQETAEEKLALNNLTRDSQSVAPVKVGGFSETNYPFLFYAFKDEKSKKYGINLSLDQALFDAEFRQRIETYTQDIITRMLAHSDSAIKQDAILTEKEKNRLVSLWNDTQVDYPQHACVHELFEAQVEKMPESIALICDDSFISYYELNRRANQLAHFLIAKGVKADQGVGICFNHSFNMIISILAALKAGACYVPLDAKYPQQRLSTMIEESRCSIVLTDSELDIQLAFLDEIKHDQTLINLDKVNLENYSEKNTQVYTLGITADNLAYVIYTSGSTGKPKGTAICHRNISRLVHSDYIDVSTSNTLLCASSLSFDAFTFELWSALLKGARSVLVNISDFTYSELSKLLIKFNVDIAWITSALFNQIVIDSPQHLYSLKQLIVGGEALSKAHIQDALTALPNTKIINGYGPTENTTFSCTHDIKRLEVDEFISVPIGRPISNTQAYVLGVDGRLTATGVVGELYLGGDGLARGYLNRAGLTAERFLPNPFSKTSGQRLYRTGDLVRYLNNGDIEFIGRADYQVKVRGFRIELGEIENSLLKLSKVKDAVVVAREDAQASRYIVAYIVLSELTNLTDAQAISELRLSIGNTLPEYMVPSAFVLLEALPLTINGKVDRNALPAPKDKVFQVSQKPTGVTEELLANLWKEILQVETIGRDNNFFHVGGHSLLVTQLLSSIRETFKVELSIKALFENTTIQSQASLIDNSLKSGTQNLIPFRKLDNGSNVPLSYSQQRLWFLNDFMGPNAVYNMPIAIRITGQVNSSVLIRCVEKIIERHDSLRTRFKLVDNEARQIVAPHQKTLVLESINTSEQLFKLYQNESSYCFDLEKDSLCRVRILYIEEQQDYALLLTMHHIISDGWSMGVFFDELFSLYEAYAEEKECPLEPLEYQFTDFALWQREWLKGSELNRQLAFWRQYLEGSPVKLTLPTDRSRPQEQSYNGLRLSHVFKREFTAKVRDFSQRHNVTLFMTLLTGFSILMGRYASQSDVVVGTPIANRNRKETENMIGFFVNTLAMRTDFSKNENFIQLIEKARESSLQAYSYQDVPFEQLVEMLGVERSLAHTPLFQVMFALQSTPVRSQKSASIAMEPLTFEADSIPTTARYDITLSIQETSDVIIGDVEFNCDLFDIKRIKNMLTHFENLIDKLLSEPRLPVRYHNYLNCSEIDGQLAINNAIKPYDNIDKPVAKVDFAKTIFAPSILAKGIAQSIQLYSNKVANFLRMNGFRESERVLVNVDDNDPVLVIILGVLRVAGVCVLLPQKASELRRQYIQEVARAKWILRSENDMLSLEQLQNDNHVRSSKVNENECATSKLSDISAEYASLVQNSNDTAISVFDLFEHDSPQETVLSFGDLDTLLKMSHVERKLTVGKSFALLKILSEMDEATRLNNVDDNSTEIDLDCEHDCYNNISLISDKDISQTSVYLLDSSLLPIVEGAVGSIYVTYDRWLSEKNSKNLFTQECFGSFQFGTTPKKVVNTGLTGRFNTSGNIEVFPAPERKGIIKSQFTHLATRLEPIKSLLESSLFVEKIYLKTIDSKIVCYFSVSKQFSNENIRSELTRLLKDNRELVELPSVYISVSEFPLLEDDTVDSEALPVPSLLEYKPRYNPPTNDVEEAMQKIWQRTLNKERIGIDDNYFSLGGDSIRSISLVAEATECGIRFSVKDLFANPTIRSLVAFMQSSKELDEDVAEIAPYSLVTESELKQVKDSYKSFIIEDVYPMSLMQQGMVFLSLKQKEQNLYENIQIYHLDSPFDPQDFEQTIEYLVLKHPMLRSVCYLTDGRPLQVIFKDTKPNIEIIELEGLQDDEVEREVKSWMSKECQRGLNVGHELWRITVFRLSNSSFLVGIFVHHAMWDGWSLESFASELYNLYGNKTLLESEDTSGILPSFNLFIAKEQQAIKSQEYREYWLNKLSEAKLPWWNGQERSGSKLVTVDVSFDRSQSITLIAKRLGVQEKSLWCSAYLVLLSLLNGTNSVVGPVATQGRPEVPDGDKIIGVFLNALPLSINLGKTSWGEFIKTVDEELREQHKYRHYPLAEIQRHTGIEFSSSLFNYTNWHVYYDKASTVESLDSQVNSVAHGQRAKLNEQKVPQKIGGFSETNYLLLFDAFKDEASGKFGIKLSLDTGVFDSDFCHRIREHVERILNQFEQNLDGTLDKEKLLSREERNSVLNKWPAIRDRLKPTKFIHDLFDEQAVRNPDSIALIFNDKSISYSELKKRSDALAKQLKVNGIAPEVRVGLCMSKGIELVVAILSVLKSGGTYVPIDPNNPISRNEFILNDSGIEVLLTNQSAHSEFIASAKSKVTVFDLERIDWENVISSAVTDIRTVDLLMNHSAYVIYTSGSTGKPKGVVVEHKNITRLFDTTANQFEFNSNDRWTLFHSYAFDFSVWEIWGALIYGGCLTIIPSSVAKSPEDFYQLLAKQKITVLNQTPSMFNQVIKVDQALKAKLSLRTVIFGGEALEPQKLLPWFARYSDQEVAMINMYGITETTVHVSYHRIFENQLSDSNASIIGRQLADLSLYILDENQSIVPIGVCGEMYVGGGGVTRGYLARKELTNERFISNPYRPQERLYRTGDLAKFNSDGEIQYMGRIDHQVKIRGFRIELGEINSAIEGIECVSQATTLLKADVSNNKRIIAYITVNAHKDKSQDNVVEYIRSVLVKKLPAYMVPSGIVVLDEFPLTINGKLDLNKLSNMAISLQQQKYVKPSNQVERMLCDYWQELFETERVGVLDSFWDLGGHSLLAIRMSNFVKEQFGVELTMKSIFELQSVKDFANHILTLQEIQKLTENDLEDGGLSDEDEYEEGSL